MKNKSTEILQKKEYEIFEKKEILPNLDGIRAAACLLVVISHIPIPGKIITTGEIGVGIFFALSGFLMSHLYAKKALNYENILRYGIARFSRIAPIYWIVVSACIFISYYEPNSDFYMRITGATQITRHYLFGGGGFIFWSIPPEIQYYIFFIFVWSSIYFRKAHIYVLPILILACSTLFLVNTSWPGISLPHMLHFFIAGSIAGLIPKQEWLSKTERIALYLLQLASIIILISPLWLYPTKSALFGSVPLGFSFAIAIYFLSINSHWTNIIFSSYFLRKIGQASFSIYLIHGLVYHFGSRIMGITQKTYDPLWMVLGIFGVLLPMLASRFVEMPLQRITRRFLERNLLPAH
nr:acyltransferase [uncultured Albidiferax sp.]